MELLIMVGLMVLGMVLTKMNVIRQSRVNLANKWVIYVALPAVALAKIPALEVSKELIAAALAPLLIFGGAFLLFYKVLGSFLDSTERLVLSLAGGLGNTSFMGFPLIRFFYSENLLPYAVVFDQVTFLAIATLAQWMIVRSEGAFRWRDSVRKIMLFPPFLAAFVALFIPENVYPEAIDRLLTLFMESITPVAMLVVGYQVARFVDFHFTRPLIFGLTYKLVLAPLLIAFALLLTGVSEDLYRTCVVEAGMASQITVSILLLDKQIMPKLTSQMFCWSIILSFFTISGWYLILG